MIEVVFLYIIFIILGFASGVFRKVPNQYKVKGMITSLEQNHVTRKRKPTKTAVVEFFVNEKGYTTKTSYQSSFFGINKKLTVCYNRENPEENFVQTGLAIRIFVLATFVFATYLMLKTILSYIV